jgi:hypothetical protein
MDKRIRNIIGAVGILCLAAFALAPAPVRSVPLWAGISTIYQTTIGNDPLVLLAQGHAKKNNGGKKKQ